MFVKNHMLEKEKLTIVDFEERIESALKKMAQGKFMSLPVLSNGVLKGLVMKETIYKGYVEEGYNNFNDYIRNKKVIGIYNSKIQIIYEDDEIEKASYLLSKLSIPFLAVINSNNDFVRILTHFAIFNAFSKIIGLEKGFKIVADMLDKLGQLAKFTELLK